MTDVNNFFNISLCIMEILIPSPSPPPSRSPQKTNEVSAKYVCKSCMFSKVSRHFIHVISNSKKKQL